MCHVHNRHATDMTKSMVEVTQMFLQCTLLLKAIERGDQSTVEQWLQNEDTKVNDCRGGNASRHPFAVANGTTGQFTIGSWTLHSYSFKVEQVYQVLYEYALTI